MVLDKRACKVCGVEKGRVEMGRFPKGVCRRYVDEKGQFWNGKVCPDCNNERIRLHMDNLRIKRKAEKDAKKGIQS